MSMFPNARNFNIIGGELKQYNVWQAPIDVGQKLSQKLNPVMDAYISPQKLCLEGTRTEITNNITNWVFSPDDSASRIFVLYGPAGTGKSAISHTVGKKLKSLNRLGAFFSFDRTFAAERTPSRAIHSIAYNLGLHSGAFGEHLLEVMPDKDPYLLSGFTMEEEWEKLILNPAKTVKEPGPVVIIIDALDECAPQKVSGPREEFISLLFNGVHDLPPQFRILVTSRLEYDVATVLDSDGVQVQDITKLEGTQQDIYAYVCKRMSSPRVQTHRLNDAQCKLLAERAEGLFQWAYTVCEALIGGPQGGTTMQEHFEYFMSLAPSFNEGLQPLDVLYKSILEANFDYKNKKVRWKYRMVMSQILVASHPLSQSSLKEFQSAYCQFTGEEDTQESVDLVIPYLGSLLTGVDNMDTPVRPIHTSVRDFLLDEGRSGEYAIDLSVGHNTMGIGAIELMTEKLHFNMCNLPSSYLRNSEVKDMSNRILQGLPEDLSYACCCWDGHLVNIEPRQSVLDLVKRFLYSKFSLYWMEVLSILGEVDAIQRILRNVMGWIQLPLVSPWSRNVGLLIEEMKHFVDIFGRVMVEATPHMYLSTLPFIPRSSILQRIYGSDFAKTAVVCSGQMMDWPSLEVILEGHTEGVESVAFSPDGKKIVSGSLDKSVRIWNAETGKAEGNPFEGHIGYVYSVAFSPDGKRIVSGSGDNSVRIWNAETGSAEGNPLQGHTSSVNSVAFSPDGTRIVSGSGDKSVRIWNAQTGKAEGSPLQGHTSYVYSVAFSPDGKKIVSGSYDNSVRIWNAETGKAEGNPLQGHTGPAYSVAFSSDGKKIVSGSGDNSVRIWHATTGKAEVEPLQGHTDSVYSGAFSTDGKRIVSGSRDHSVRLWSADTGKPEGNPLQGHVSYVYSVAFSPDGKKIVSGSNDYSVKIWNAETGQAEGNPLQGHTSSVNSVSFSHDGTRIVSGSKDNYVRIWNADTGSAEGDPLEGHTSSVYSVAFSPDGKKIVSGSEDSSVRIWNAATGKPEGSPLQGHTDFVSSVAFSPDGKKIVSGSGDSSVRIWNAETGKAEGNPLQGHTSGVSSVAFSPDGKKIVSASYENSVRIWNVETGKNEHGLHADAPILVKAHSHTSDTAPHTQHAYALSLCPLHDGHHCLHSSPSFQTVSLRPDGWLCSSDSSLILWIPPEYRYGLSLPHLQMLISSTPMTSLDLQHFVPGTNWAQCYTGKLPTENI